MDVQKLIQDAERADAVAALMQDVNPHHVLELAEKLKEAEAKLAELAKQEPIGIVKLGEYDDCGNHPDATVVCLHEYADWDNFQDGTELFTRAAPPAPVDDLVMQIRRLVHALKKSNPDSPLIAQVSDYMQRSGYWQASDCLRSVADE